MMGTGNRKFALVRSNLSTLIILPGHCYVATKIVKCSGWEFITPILLAIINTCIMMSAVFGIKNYLFAKLSFMQFFPFLVGGAIFYFAAAYLLDRYFSYGI